MISGIRIGHLRFPGMIYQAGQAFSRRISSVFSDQVNADSIAAIHNCSSLFCRAAAARDPDGTGIAIHFRDGAVVSSLIQIFNFPNPIFTLFDRVLSLHLPKKSSTIFVII
ncbi:MAG: hypothetical protein LUO89_10455 [Methanothrix sp.]|nr:hypothetical protein [Methanothrix sp.]